MDGLYHASVFTTRNEPEVIRMRKAGVEVVHKNCIRCHQDQVVDVKLAGTVSDHTVNMTDRKCWECHKEVPHGKIHSLSSVKYYGKVPEEHQETVPEWLRNYMNDLDRKPNK